MLLLLKKHKLVIFWNEEAATAVTASIISYAETTTNLSSRVPTAYIEAVPTGTATSVLLLFLQKRKAGGKKPRTTN